MLPDTATGAQGHSVGLGLATKDDPAQKARRCIPELCLATGGRAGGGEHRGLTGGRAGGGEHRGLG